MYEKINNNVKYEPPKDDNSMKNELKNYLKNLKQSNTDIPSTFDTVKDTTFSTY